MIQIYNTLTNEKEPFTPQKPNEVLMYVCGPTVYNYIHIGNARSVVAFDTIRRYLEYRGYTVKFVSNFTDVDDKIIKASQETGMAVDELTDKYISAFYEDTAALNVKRATVNPRVRENIPAIIDFIQQLIDKGYAYVSAGDVYYRTRKFAHYGELSGQTIDDLEQGASARTDARDQDKKEDPLDFALWKAAKPGEISWDAPWGSGRPGWHIECSVMATKYLEATVDIHGGGQDLEFPHHENEIAQSEAVTGQPFARYWMHNGFVTVGTENEKMSKSAGNFVTVHELLKQVDPQVLRFLIATVQYRHPIQYSDASLQEAEANLTKLRTAVANTRFRLADARSGHDAAVEKQFATLEAQFKDAMDDDFNVQNGIAVAYEMAKVLNTYSAQNTVSCETLTQLLDRFTTVMAIFGITFPAETKETDDDAWIDALIAKREAAREQRDFATSDQIRDELKEQGIILEDTPQGTRWKRA